MPTLSLPRVPCIAIIPHNYILKALALEIKLEPELLPIAIELFELTTSNRPESILKTRSPLDQIE